MNGRGQLGRNGEEHELRPVALPGEAAQVACAWTHTLAVSAGGALLGWGKNERGQLGLGHRQNQSLPQPVPLPAGMGALRVASLGFAVGTYYDSCVLAVLG